MAPFRRSSLLPLWLLLTASCAAAAMPPTKVSERLVMPPTPGYVALTESVNPNGSRVMQMVPTHQSAQNWTDMLKGETIGISDYEHDLDDPVKRNS